MIGQILYDGKTKRGKPYIIRYPKKGDAQAMCDYINMLSKEHTFIRFQGEQMTLVDETKYLNEQLERIKDHKTVQLLILLDNKVVGNAAVDLRDKTESHEGILGISIAQNIRGEGIGKIFMHLLLEEAEKRLDKLRIITLGVFGDNKHAKKMYESFGFQEYGRLPEGLLHDKKYVDHIYMYKKIR